MLKIKKMRPMFNQLITTLERYGYDNYEDGIMTSQKGDIKEYQKVLAVGSSVNEVKVGDVVLIDPTRYAERKHQEGSMKDGIISDNPVVKYNFNTIKINGEDCLIIYDSDVSFILDDYEEVVVEAPKSKIIVNKPHIIV